MQNKERELLENYIKAKGVKVRWIAKQIGLSESTLSHWRKGRRNISTKHLQALVDIINKNS
jgi:transcriptional regulator with XRE-family HTH domain